MTSKRILIADDEPLYRQTTAELLRKAGFECVCVSNGSDAIAELKSQHFDLVLSDLNMPGNMKMELLRDHNKNYAATPIIVITGVPSLPTAIESVRLGIADYLLKPVKFEDLLTSVRSALEKARRQRDSYRSNKSTRLGGSDDSLSGAGGMLGQSAPMRELFETIERVAQSDSNVLITGESGTGKEEVAQSIHRASSRSTGLFQVIDCTAIPETLFESTVFGHKKGAFTGAISDQVGLLSRCHGGTAFLDELGELPLTLQAKLLRAVQQQTFTPLGGNTVETVDTRFICATNRDLQREMTSGRFRQDLFYRLAVIHIHVPPLRVRGDDILLLAEHFLRRLQGNGESVRGFDSDAQRLLSQYSWPGNIRELQNVIERALVMAQGGVITAKELTSITAGADASCDSSFDAFSPQAADDSGPADRSAGSQDRAGVGSRDAAVRAAERNYLVGLLESLNGNVSEAARQAGLSRQGLHKLLRAHDIEASKFRGGKPYSIPNLPGE